MWSLLAFGVIVGMQHALEADHLAAVAALSARKSTRRGLVLRGAWWGFGHTVALLAVSLSVILLGMTVSSRVEAILELCVGIVVAGLGLNLLRAMIRRRIHFHRHDHGDGHIHLHAHSHAGEATDHAVSAHRHRHPEHGLGKAMAIGLLHGAAGSGALLVLIVAATKSAAVAFAYVACFGLGSIIGMATLSFVASFPLRAAERGAAWLNTATLSMIGVAAILIGGNTILTGWQSMGL